MYNLIDDPRYDTDRLGISTDTRMTVRGAPRTTGEWALYVNGRKLHGGLHSIADAEYVRDLYLLGVVSTDPRWAQVGGKQPSPRTDDMRRAREDMLMAEAGCTRAEASERVTYEHAHNLLNRHELV